MSNPKRNNVLRAIVWAVFYLVIIDLGINMIFAYPSDPQNTNPGTLQAYFEYGRSIEGKFDRMTRPTNEESAPLVSRGWIESNGVTLPSANIISKHQIRVSVYGMSHTKLLGEALGKNNSDYIVHEFTAPGAPANWAFAAYQADIGWNKSDVVVLGVMTDNVAFLSATSGATSYFDMGHPYTFPRYHVQGDQIKPLYPPFYTGKGYREYYYNEAKWQMYREWLSENDKYYDPLLFRRSVADKSALLRLIRRAYAEMTRQKKLNTIYTKDGFNANSEEVTSLHGIIKEFGRVARAAGSVPIIYIVNNQGREDHLYRVLKPVLERENIPYLSTHFICPPDDPRIFLSVNSHFIPSKDAELASELNKIIRRELEKNQMTKRRNTTLAHG